MPVYQCPFCRCQPVALQRRPSRRVACQRCGRTMLEQVAGGRGYRLALVGALTLLVLAALPDVFQKAFTLAANTSLPVLLERFSPEPPPEERPLALLDDNIFAILSQADRDWLPKAEELVDGGVRFSYKRRPGDPEMTVAELRAMMESPPTYEAEQQAIRSLLASLQAAGVRLSIEPPRKHGAAAEWDHIGGTLRIDPGVLRKGTVDFARVLNHEAVHVAQSCAAGHLRARPQKLGLDRRMAPELAAHLLEPLYQDTNSQERVLEEEAYATQNRLGSGEDLIKEFCRLKPDATAAAR
ncbi:MAG: hypothetical protein ACK5QQ_00090 [Cyanobacteriota bacterium]